MTRNDKAYDCRGGVALLLLGLLLFNISMFILLALVGRAWFLYSRKPLDYVEVDDDDPFIPPRGMPTMNQSANVTANNAGASN